jgi:hypothetical protein
VDRFLNSQTEAGTVISVGSRFTISKEDAVRKLAEHGLDRSDKALLRLLQLGIASGARRTDVQFEGERVTFDFRRIDRGPLFEHQINESVRTALLGCLHNGFGAGTFCNPKVEWSLDPLHFEVSASLLQNPAVGVPPSGNRNLPGQVTLKLRREFERSGWLKQFSRARNTASEFSLLAQRLGHAPFEVVIDQFRPIPTTLERPCFLTLSLKGPHNLLEQGVAPILGSQGSGVREVVRSARPEFFAPAFPHHQHGDNASLRHLVAQLCLLRVERSGGQIRFVKHGVEVGICQWPYAGYVEGVVSAVRLDLDVSGLQIVRNDKVNSLLQYLREELATAASEL